MTADARKAAGAKASARAWFIERHSLTEAQLDDLELTTACREMRPGMARATRYEQERMERNGEAADLAELRAIVTRLGDSFGLLPADWGARPLPPQVQRHTALRLAVDDFIASVRIDFPRAPGDTDEKEFRREVRAFVRTFLALTTARSGVETTATDAVLLDIALGYGEPITGVVGADGNDPWQTRTGRWRTALARLRELEADPD
jgi:hypothetical protein